MFKNIQILTPLTLSHDVMCNSPNTAAYGTVIDTTSSAFLAKSIPCKFNSLRIQRPQTNISAVHYVHLAETSMFKLKLKLKPKFSNQTNRMCLEVRPNHFHSCFLCHKC